MSLVNEDVHLTEDAKMTLQTTLLPDDSKEYFLASLAKRIFGGLDIILLIANTSSAITTQSSITAWRYLQSDVELNPSWNWGSLNVCINNDTDPQSYDSSTLSDCTLDAWSCDKTVINAGIQCSFEDNASYIGFQAAWVTFLVVYFFIKIYSSTPYATNDLRYFLSVDRFATTNTNKYIVYAAYLLTLASVIVLCYYLALVEQSFAGAFTFGILNAYLFYQSTSSRWPAFNNMQIEKKSFKEMFPTPIILKISTTEPALTNCYGMLVSSTKLYDELLLAVFQSDELKDDKYLAAYGNPKEIRDAFHTLYELDSLTDDKIKN